MCQSPWGRSSPSEEGWCRTNRTSNLVHRPCLFPHLSSQKGVICSMPTAKYKFYRCTVESRSCVKVLPQKLTPQSVLHALIWGANSPACRSSSSKHTSETLWITGFRNGVKKLSCSSSEFGVIERDLTHHSSFWQLFVYTTMSCQSCQSHCVKGPCSEQKFSSSPCLYTQIKNKFITLTIWEDILSRICFKIQICS